MFIESLGVYFDEFPKEAATVFLTHWHSDHLHGLRRTFPGTIICSLITSRMLKNRWAKNIQATVLILEPHKEEQRVVARRFPVVGLLGEKKKYGFVTVFDANHLPGSLMFYFSQENIFYTGDYRWNKTMAQQLPTIIKPNSLVYFDGTFHDPALDFLTEEESVRLMETTLDQLLTRVQPPTQVIIGVFHLGMFQLLQKLKYKFTVLFDTFSNTIRTGLKIMYNITPDSNKSTSRILVANLKKLNVVKEYPKYPIIVPSALWFTCEGTPSQISGPVQDKQGRIRINFSCHSDYKENLQLFTTVQAKETILLGKPKIKLQCENNFKSIFTPLLHLNSPPSRYLLETE